MEPQRILLANVPRFLDETLQRALANVPGLQIVGEVDDWTLVPSAIRQTDAQWIIVSLPSGTPMSQAGKELLAAYPTVRLLNVATDGGHITLQWVEPHEQTIDDFSMRELVALLTSPPPAPLLDR
jgi:DNA-binding NarL/FixJ family response regulator